MKNKHFPEINGKFGFGCMRFPTVGDDIDIPKVMIELSNLMKNVPSWRKISEERAEEARKLSGNIGK